MPSVIDHREILYLYDTPEEGIPYVAHLEYHENQTRSPYEGRVDEYLVLVAGQRGSG